mgnify:FL=1
MYVSRWAEEKIKKLFDIFPVVVLTGPRQVGKTTTAKMFSEEGAYVNFDDIYVLHSAKIDPKSIIPDSELVVIDEVQRFPEILLVIKEIVDKDANRKFLLTGSSSLLVMKGVSESLAGRAGYVTMYPFTIGEVMEKPPNLPDLLKGEVSDAEPPGFSFSDLLKKGLFPKPFFMDGGWNEWYRMYVTTYVEKEFRMLSNIVDLSSFASFMVMSFHSISSLFNESEIAKEIGVSQPTVHRYSSILTSLNISIKLPVFSKSSGGVKKRVKLYAIDPALVRYTLHLDLTEEWEGKLLENLVFNQLKVQIDIMNGQLFYYRSKNLEVDFLVKKGEILTLFEVKRSGTTLRTLKRLVETKKDLNATAAYIVTIEGKPRELSSGVWEIPFWMI